MNLALLKRKKAPESDLAEGMFHGQTWFLSIYILSALESISDNTRLDETGIQEFSSPALPL